MVQIENPEAGIWTIGVVDATGLRVVDFHGLVSAGVPTLTFTGASGGSDHAPVLIEWDAFDVDSDAAVSLYYDDDGAGYDGVLITSGLAEADGPGCHLWDTSSAAPGTYHLYAVTDDGDNPPVFAYAGTTVTISDLPPQVTSTEVNDGQADPRQLDSIAFTFSENMSVSLGVFSLVLTDDRTGLAVDISDLTDTDLTWNIATNTATWDLAGVPVSAGYYTAKLRSEQVVDDWGNGLDGDSDGSAGGDYALNFTIGLQGDLNDDGYVGLDDLDMVLGSWNQTVPPGDAAADLSGDGFVGLDDLDIVLGNWNASMPAPPIAGDLNADVFVGLDDLDSVLDSWNQNVVPGYLAAGDPSGDGYVGLDDLDVVLNNWNTGTPAIAIVSTQTIDEVVVASVVLDTTEPINSHRQTHERQDVASRPFKQEPASLNRVTFAPRDYQNRIGAKATGSGYAPWPLLHKDELIVLGLWNELS